VSRIHWLRFLKFDTLARMASRSTQPKPPVLRTETVRALYAAASEFHRLSPWEYLSDNNLLGLQDAGGRVRLVSVLGNADEAFGLRVHRGEQGVRWALTLATGEECDGQDPNFLHSQDSLFVEFVPRRELEQHDLTVLNKIGFKPLSPGRRGWPKFRSQRPGAAPWYLEQAEAKMLLSDLRKAIQFCRLVAIRKHLFRNRDPNEVAFYPKSMASNEELSEEQLTWQKLVLTEEPPPELFLLSDSQRALLARLPRRQELSIEIDCLYSPGLVSDGSRPFFPWLSLAVNAKDGVILGIELANSRTEKPEDVTGRCLIKVLSKLKCRPREFAVKRHRLAVALSPVAEALDAAVFQVSSLPFVELAYADLRRSMNERRRAA
jgi:hypothetical protein